jgi:hypothetical protein
MCIAPVIVYVREADEGLQMKPSEILGGSELQSNTFGIQNVYSDSQKLLICMPNTCSVWQYLHTRITVLAHEAKQDSKDVHAFIISDDSSTTSRTETVNLSPSKRCEDNGKSNRNFNSLNVTKNCLWSKKPSNTLEEARWRQLNHLHRGRVDTADKLMGQLMNSPMTKREVYMPCS